MVLSSFACGKSARHSLDCSKVQKPFFEKYNTNPDTMLPGRRLYWKSVIFLA